MRKVIAGFLVASTVLSLAPAHAQIKAEVSISNFRYTLIDLDPNDGLTPSITFLSPGLYSSAASGSVISELGEVSERNVGVDTFKPVAVSVSSPLAHVHSEISGTLWSDFAMTSSLEFAGPYLHATGASTSLSSGRSEFVLSPRTAVKFAVDTSYSGSVGLYDGSETHRKWLATLSTLRVWGDVSPSFHHFVAGDDSAGATTLYVNWENAGWDTSTRYLELGVSIGTVPEPSTWAMLVGGLLVLGAMMRRHRSLS